MDAIRIPAVGFQMILSDRCGAASHISTSLMAEVIAGFLTVHMFKILALVSSIFAVSCQLSAQETPANFRVMTYNIRYDNTDDGVNRWSARRDAVGSLIKFHNPDIICTQEGLRSQLDQMSRMLEGYLYCGKGRDDGDKAGEHCAIFYRSDRFELLADSTFWLSPTRSIPSKAWDAALPRIVTWAHFKDRKTQKTFFVFNTHFDHEGVIARTESAKLLKSEVPRITSGKPAILAGDFNSTDSDQPYKTITNGAVNGAFGMTDTRQLSHTRHHGPNGTCCGFDFPGPITGKTIDFIFVSFGWKVDMHATLSDLINGRFPSDHLPVMVELVAE
jgi:endonuclease/exonuclease/phosphatase family metal-dependent hydrolase